MLMDIPRLDLASLRTAYVDGATPSAIIDAVYRRVVDTGLNPVWISLVPWDQAVARAREIEQIGQKGLPLYGVPFAVKDNIDVAGIPTTAGCPAYAYTPTESATVVRLLEEAGAIVIGKTNLDQFATGLVGVRSPYGACSSVFHDHYVSGGSSSGSAVAVASGLVSFSLGTDTAGSGRVPAAFNNLIGLKPTKGALSTKGVVPACRTLDCVSIFALTSSDAAAILDVARAFDPADPYSRAVTDAPAAWFSGGFTYGVPKVDQLQFFGDDEATRLYNDSVLALEAMGGSPVEIDYQPFLDAAALLYSGPWVAERLAALSPFIDDHGDEVHHIVHKIVMGAAGKTAVDAFRAQYRLQELRRKTDEIMLTVDFLLLPTTGTTYTIAEVEADPIALNTNLGYYTNFVNLLDMAAVALPAGMRTMNGATLPFGVTLIGPAGTDRALLAAADALHRKIDGNVDVGGGLFPLAETPPMADIGAPGCTLVAVVGAHLTGMPLNWQLTKRGARLVSTTRTSAGYHFYALPNTTPPKPGLVHDPAFDGPGIEVEVWAIPTSNFGVFVAEVVSPLGIGTVDLADGTKVKGFICEPYAVEGAVDITEFGGWRNYLKSR